MTADATAADPARAPLESTAPADRTAARPGVPAPSVRRTKVADTNGESLVRSVLDGSGASSAVLPTDAAAQLVAQILASRAPAVTATAAADVDAAAGQADSASTTSLDGPTTPMVPTLVNSSSSTTLGAPPMARDACGAAAHDGAPEPLIVDGATNPSLDAVATSGPALPATLGATATMLPTAARVTELVIERPQHRPVAQPPAAVADPATADATARLQASSTATPVTPQSAMTAAPLDAATNAAVAAHVIVASSDVSDPASPADTLRSHLPAAALDASARSHAGIGVKLAAAEGADAAPTSDPAAHDAPASYRLVSSDSVVARTPVDDRRQSGRGSGHGNADAPADATLPQPAVSAVMPTRDAPAAVTASIAAPTHGDASAAAPSATPIVADAPTVTNAPAAVPTDRITIKLSDDAGAPTIRVAIRGDRVDARIVTNDPVLTRLLEQGARELSGALQAQGFDDARVQVRGTASANDGKGLVNIAGSASGMMRDAGTPQGDGESRSSGRHAPEQRPEQGFEERPRQEQGRQRRWLLDEEER